MMPSQRQSSGKLQRQGVPIPEKLEGPNVTKQSGQTSRRTRAPQRQSRPRANQGRRNVSHEYDAAAAGAAVGRATAYSPTKYGEKSSSGIGLLEAEYFGIIFILVVGLLFGSDSYGNKMMSFMKRGFLTSILFFFLALVAGVGPNAAKITKGIGALVFVAILVSTPGQAVVDTLDNFFKQDWIGSSETANQGGSASADAGTSDSGTSNLQKAASAIESAGSSSSSFIGTAASTFIELLKGII